MAKGGTNDSALMTLLDDEWLQPTALILPENMDFGRWQQLGRVLLVLGRGTQWWLGDFLAFGEAKYGEVFSQIVELYDYDPDTLRAAKWVSERVPPSRRNPEVSWSHHREVAALDPDEQEEWLELSELNEWSRNQLRTEIRRATYLRQQGSVNGAARETVTPERTESPTDDNGNERFDPPEEICNTKGSNTLTPEDGPPEAARNNELSRNPDGVVMLGDALDLVWSVPDRSIDLLLTEPPHWDELDDPHSFVQEWLARMMMVVKDDGHAYVWLGDDPRELSCYLEQAGGMLPLQLGSVLVWKTGFRMEWPSSVRYMPNWRPILHFHGADARPLNTTGMSEHFAFQDARVPTPQGGDRIHEWQLPDDLAERLVRHGCPEGGTVFDPFAGTGTFLAAAVRLRRRAVGFETSPMMIEFCQDRGISVVQAVPSLSGT